MRLVIPYPPGGGTDTIVRPLAQRLGESLKQQVIVDNRGGAGGNIGMELVAKSPPDGYTIVFALTAPARGESARSTRKCRTTRSRISSRSRCSAAGPYIILVHPSLPAKSIKELIALARARPNQITYASSGSGSGGHLAIELLEQHGAREDAAHPLQRRRPGAGRDDRRRSAGARPRRTRPRSRRWTAGALRALAVSTSKRLTGVDLPTVAESGLPGFDAGVWYAFLAPAGTPREIVTKLNTRNPARDGAART